MSDEVTRTLTVSLPRGRRATGARAPALVIIWCAEGERAGEVCVLGSSGDHLLGRGPGDPDERVARARFVRQRPGHTEPAPPLGGGGLSRRQLLLRADGTGVRIERLGRAPVAINGERVTGGTALPGDVISITGQLSLWCTTRPLELPAQRYFPKEDWPEFGAADRFGIIGESPATWALREQIAFASATDRHALVVGETGTGKELAVRAIHSLSGRSARPLVSRSAATIPSGLIDAELFGNCKDYPNPGMSDRPGLIGEAADSTLFLDEIGELPAELQARLLRVLDADGEYQRLGESKMRRSQFRLIAATNRDPDELKHDLLARLTVRLSTPSLNDRREDVPLIARHLLRRALDESEGLQQAHRGEPPALTGALLERLVRHRYRHNIRELDGLLWRALSEATDRVELTKTLERELPMSAPESAPAERAELTREQVVAALERHGWNKNKAWRELGLPSRYSLYRLLKKLGIDGP